MTQTYKTKTIYYGSNFDVELMKFESIIEVHKGILNSIPEVSKKKIMKNGIVSHAIKELIKDFNKVNWRSYVAYMKKEGRIIDPKLLQNSSNNRIQTSVQEVENGNSSNGE